MSQFQKKKNPNKKKLDSLYSPNYKTPLKRSISSLINSIGNDAKPYKRTKNNDFAIKQTINNPVINSLRREQFWYLEESERTYIRNRMDNLRNLPNSDRRILNYWRNPYTRMYIGRSDLFTLLRNNWLNSFVIDAFLAGFHRQYDTSGSYKLLNCYFFTFLNKIDKTDEEQRTFSKITANWTVEDLNKDIIFPIHRPSHWLLCVISKNRKCISLIDHFYGDNYNEYYLAIKQWYRTLQVKIVGDSEPGVIWSKKLHKDYSMCKQTDSSSCGPLASMTAAHYIFSGEFPTSSINFSQNDVPNLREYMLWMILNLRETEFSSTIVIEDDVDLIEIIDQISRLERQEDTDISKLDEKHIEDNSSI